MAWGWPNKGRNMSPCQYTIFIVYKLKCFVIDWHVEFIYYNTSGWKTLNINILPIYNIKIPRKTAVYDNLTYSLVGEYI